MSALDQRKVRVRCRNEACGWGWLDDSPSQRKARSWSDKPCPRCSCAVELAPGVSLEPRELEPLPGLEERGVGSGPAQAVRSLFEGLKAAPLELPEVPRVAIRTFRLLAADPRMSPTERVEQIVEAWAAQQKDPPGWG